MDVKNLFIETISNIPFWGAIIATILIISIGWAIVKVKWFKVEWKDVLIALVLKVTYPMLILKSFMATTYQNEFVTHGTILGLSVFFYVFGCLAYLTWSKYILPKLVARKIKYHFEIGEIDTKTRIDKNLNLWMMCIFGSTVFFGTPIINALFGDAGLTAQILWTTPYTIAIASFCQFQYLGIKFNRRNIKFIIKSIMSPTTICTLIGFTLWISQLIPGSLINGPLYDNISIPNSLSKGVWWFDLEYTAPFLYKTIDLIQSLTSPLIWISIGVTIASNNLKNVIKDKDAWKYTLIKLFIIPAIVMLLVGGFGKINNTFHFDIDTTTSQILSHQTNAIAIITILMATPPASICIAYAIKTKRNPTLGANASIISTIFTPIAIPIWVILSTLYADGLGLINFV